MTIVDDRKEYANAERFPEAAQTLAVEFHDAFNHLTVKSSSYIVIVTRGHRSDEDALERALHTPAKYIGMIGSKRKVLTTYEHLVERGVTVTMLQRVHAPIGLEIGAVTAEEIGVSIVAELVQIRRGGSLPLRHKAEVMRELMEYLRLKQAGRIP
jgi:xanthine dehydrogenase accessory factor